MNLNDNKIVQSLWIFGELSNNELIGVNSYLFHGHEFHLYVYEDIKNVPTGVVIKDANTIIPKSMLFKDSKKSLAAFSDWFRFKLLYDKGGWWVDIDTICIQPLTIYDRYCFSSEEDVNGNALINATCIKSAPKAGFLKDCLEYIDTRDREHIEFGEFGLTLYRTALVKYEYVDFQKSPKAFCPINWFNVSDLITQHNFAFSQETYTVHLWNEMWRRGFLNKNATYHPESLYERLKRKFI